MEGERCDYPPHPPEQAGTTIAILPPIEVLISVFVSVAFCLSLPFAFPYILKETLAHKRPLFPGFPVNLIYLSMDVLSEHN